MAGAWDPLATGGGGSVDVKKAGSLIGTRGGINLIEGSNVTLTVTDDAANNEVDVTIAASASSVSAVGARAYRSSNTSIANATVASIAFNAEDWDTDSMHSTVSNTSRLTVPAGKGGKWLVVGSIAFATNGTGIRMPRIHVNGSAGYRTTPTFNPVGGGFQTIAQVSDIVDVAAGDYFELYGYQTSGGSLNILAGSEATFLAAIYLG